MAAVVVALVATEVSQARERRLGRGLFGRRAYVDGYVSGTGYVYGTVPGSVMAGGIVVQPGSQGTRTANYFAPDGAGPLTQPNRALIEVRVPPGAEVTFDGEKTTQMGGLRPFVSPPLTAGQPYSYKVTARWQEGGREVVRTRTVKFQAGERVGVDLTRPSPEDRAQD
jgi:uncharacterized protein (TIGR03000 family)